MDLDGRALAQTTDEVISNAPDDGTQSRRQRGSFRADGVSDVQPEDRQCPQFAGSAVPAGQQQVVPRGKVQPQRRVGSDRSPALVIGDGAAVQDRRKTRTEGPEAEIEFLEAEEEVLVEQSNGVENLSPDRDGRFPLLACASPG